MNKKMLLIVAILTAALIMTACSNTGSNNKQQTDSSNEAIREGNDGHMKDRTNDGDNQAIVHDPPVAAPLPEDTVLPDDESGSTSDDEDATEPASSSDPIALLHEALAIGMTKEEVTELLGGTYSEVIIAMDDAEGWRYDWDAADGYRFEETLDSVDIEGLKRGDLSLQIFIQFDTESRVNGYSAYQANSDSSITVYQWLENGETWTDTIY